MDTPAGMGKRPHRAHAPILGQHGRAIRARAGLLLATIASAALAGCLPVPGKKDIRVSEPPPPVQSTPSQGIIKALTCIRDSHVLNRIRFGIAVHSDGTGKTQYGYEGATGSFLPQGTAAIWASEAVIRAGGLSMNYYELNTERALRQFGGNNLDQALASQQQARVPNFIVSTAFTALDFLGGPDADIRVGGIGPYYTLRGASLEVSAEMYRPGDRMTMAISSLSRRVYYEDGGVSIAKIVGKGNGTLVTGSIGFTDQERLQEATRDVIALSVADVLASMPIVPDNCRKMVEELKGVRQPEPPAPRRDRKRAGRQDGTAPNDPKPGQDPQNPSASAIPYSDPAKPRKH